jgi:hypothetical protein
MQTDPVVAKASELMRLDIMPTLDEIRNGKVRPTTEDGWGQRADWTEHLGNRLVQKGVRLYEGI